MPTCIPCLNTKSVMKDIVSQVKDLSLKVAKGHKKKSREAKGSNVKVEASQEKEEEWIAEPEPGVLINLVSLADGYNRLKKIRFSEERFDTLGAQKWWSDNYDKLVELFSIYQENQLSTATQSEDEAHDISDNRSFMSRESVAMSQKIEKNVSNIEPYKENSTTMVAERPHDKITEWVVEDEPGVFVTIHALPDGSKDLMRVELSRERFGEAKARVWWEENKARLKKQYS